MARPLRIEYEGAFYHMKKSGSGLDGLLPKSFNFR
jgi:hypothetical protein